MGAINYGRNDIVNVGYKENGYYEDIEYELSNYNFEFFKVELKNGYYEGFYIDIEFRFLWLDNYKEKMQALKEATQLGRFLRMVIKDYGMVCYNADWVTTWYDKKTSLGMVKNAIREQKKLIKGLYTEKTLTIDKWKELVGFAK